VVPGGALIMGISDTDLAALVPLLLPMSRESRLLAAVFAAGFRPDLSMGPGSLPLQAREAAQTLLDAGTLDEIEHATSLDDNLQALVDDEVMRARPLRTVTVAPFLCARRPLSQAQVDGKDAADAA